MHDLKCGAMKIYDAFREVPESIIFSQRTSYIMWPVFTILIRWDNNKNTFKTDHTCFSFRYMGSFTNKYKLKNHS